MKKFLVIMLVILAVRGLAVVYQFAVNSIFYALGEAQDMTLLEARVSVLTCIVIAFIIASLSKED